jgi:hypothetical protein
MGRGAARVLERVLEAFATATGGETIAVGAERAGALDGFKPTDRAVMRSGDGHLLVLTTGDLPRPRRPDLDEDRIALLVSLCDAWLRMGEAFRSAGVELHANAKTADAAVRDVREELRACL